MVFNRSCALISLSLAMTCLPGDVLPATHGQSTHTFYGVNGHLRVPLEIRDNSNVARKGWPVTTGIPMPYGRVQTTDRLRLVDTNGRELPCQFTVLSRYSARDNSIRWVLLDFQIDLPADGSNTLYLTDDKQPRPISNPIQIVEKDDVIHIDTGPLQAVVPRNSGQILKQVRVEGKVVIKAGSDDGASVRAGEVKLFERFHGPAWNTHGWDKKRELVREKISEATYYSAYDAPREVRVESAGPLHAVVLIRGRHMPSQEGAGIRASGFYNYSTRLHFYRGRRFIKVEHSIDNSDPDQPNWNLMFHEARLSHSLALGPEVRVHAGGQTEPDEGPKEAAQVVSGGQEVWLYQNRGIVKKPHGRAYAYPGEYRTGLSEGGTIFSPTAAGRRARYLDVSDGTKGVAIAMRYFWEHAPRAIAASSQRLDIILHADAPGHSAPPQQHRPEYDLDFGERNMHDVLYYFHRGDPQAANIAAVAEAFEYPLLAQAPPSWYAHTGAWYFEISPTPKKEQGKENPDRHWQPSGIGPYGHGRNASYNSGGHHDSLNSGWLSFMRTGSLHELEKNLAMSRWSISHNPGWVYTDNVLRFGNEKERYTTLDRQLQAWNQLTAYGPKNFYLWRDDEVKIVETKKGPKEQRRGGWSYLNGYKVLPDHEHYALFRLFEYYYLTGDRRALEAIHGFVNWAINFQHKHLFKEHARALSDTDYFRNDPEALHRGHYSRVYTWMLYTTLAGFHATGSKVFDEFARWQVRRLLALARHRHGQLTSYRAHRSPKVEAELDPGSGKLIFTTRAQTWMEAQGVLALHEAYKTYGDERILDGLWALADYFSHHVLYFPRVGMLNNRQYMPNRFLGTGAGRAASLTPNRHDRHFQIWPLLYHYTGWDDVAKRYQRFEKARKSEWVRDWFLQTGVWERQVVPKRSSRAPELIADLRVTAASREGVTLEWTAPADDGPSGRAERYFVKYSTKPIVAFAPTDNPAREPAKARIIQQTEDLILKRAKGKKHFSRRDLAIEPGDVDRELEVTPRWDPEWHKVDAFWMAEHVSGEPSPGTPGSVETFTVRELRPHDWFGTADQPDVASLPPGRYYFAVCSWDEDRNLSRLSNVVEVDLP